MPSANLTSRYGKCASQSSKELSEEALNNGQQSLARLLSPINVNNRIAARDPRKRPFRNTTTVSRASHTTASIISLTVSPNYDNYSLTHIDTKLSYLQPSMMLFPTPISHKYPQCLRCIKGTTTQIYKHHHPIPIKKQVLPVLAKHTLSE